MTDAVRAALAGLELLFKREGEDASDAFERVAEVFRRETGYLRPGKDCRLHDIDVRRAAWDAWYASKIEAARAALSEQPAPKTACKGIPRVGCNYLAECDSVCNKCGKVHAVHLIPGVGSTAPVERVTLSEEDIRHCANVAHGRGPNTVDTLSGFSIAFARAVIAEYERLNGISATPRQPLSEARIEDGRHETFSTNNPFCPCDSKTMLKAVRWAERAHGITPAQGKETQG